MVRLSYATNVCDTQATPDEVRIGAAVNVGFGLYIIDDIECKTRQATDGNHYQSALLSSEGNCCS